MGLDWLAGNRPIEGQEELFWRLFGELEAEMDDDKLERWHQIGVPAYRCVGAPVVGENKLADAWLEERLAAKGFFGANRERKLREMAGHVALELAPSCDGLPVYSHGGLYDGVDATSFRGEMLVGCEAAIGPALLQRAYDRKRPEPGLAYGHALRERAAIWAREHGCEHVIGVYQLVAASPEEHVAHVVDSAGRWCLYWASRGHLLDVWV